jgi:hypothetical protein
MATTTPNYGWDVPTSTDYVADGAVAIETLGDDIDASLFSITGGKNVGHQFITSATLTGTAVTVTSAFSSTYDAYQLVFSNIRSSSGQNTQLQMGTTNTGYYHTEIVCSGSYATASGNAQFSNTNNGAQFTTGIISATTTNEISGGIVNVINPFLTTSTILQSLGVDARPGGLGPRTNTGFHNAATSFTSFTVLCGGGSFTSGTVRVYGLRNS